MSEDTRPIRDFFQSLPQGTPTFLVGSDLTRIPLATVGGGVVVSIQQGPGINVDSMDARNPTVGLSPDAITALALADSSLQPGGVDITDIDASGNPDDTTYLRGDGTWATPSGSGSGVVETVVAGTGIDVDSADIANPVVALNGSSINSLLLADTAVQPADLGTAAYADVTAFATASQGSLADTALQPDAIGVSVQAYDASTAKLNIDQQWVAPQRSSITGLSVAGGVIDWNLSSGNDFTVLLTSNAVLNMPANLASHVGQKGRILITQGGVGGWTLGVNANLIPIGTDEVPEIPTDPGSMAYLAYDVISATQIAFTLAGIGE